MGGKNSKQYLGTSETNRINIKHKKWRDDIIINDDMTFQRHLLPNEKGRILFHNSNMTLVWDKYDTEDYNSGKLKIVKPYNRPFLVDLQNKFIENRITKSIKKDNQYDLYLINLDTRPDRKQFFLDNIPNIFNVNIFNAIRHPKGFLGCSLSHLSLISYAKQNNLPYIIVAEDDCKLLKNSEEIKEILDILTSNLDKWEVFNGTPFTTLFDKLKVEESFNTKLLNASGVLTTSFMIYNKNFYGKMLSYDFSEPIDEIIFKTFPQTIVKNGPLGIQELFYSDITKVNRDNEYKQIFYDTYKKISNKQISPYIPLECKVIPRIVHFVFGLKEQTEEFNLVYALSIISAKEIINPEKIYFWYHHEPYGKWWDKVKPLLELHKVDIPEKIGNKLVKKIAHKADIIRMQKLLEYGGIYLDMDTISVKSIDHLLSNQFVMGKEGNYGLCNAIMFSAKNSTFLQEWWNNYENMFDTDGWGEASILYPLKLSKTNKNIKIVPEETFFKPTYTEVDSIFKIRAGGIPPQLLILHLWESFSMKYYTFNSINDIVKTNTLYGKIVLHLCINTNILNYLFE